MICYAMKVLEDSMHKCTMSHVSGGKTGISHSFVNNVWLNSYMHTCINTQPL